MWAVKVNLEPIIGSVKWEDDDTIHLKDESQIGRRGSEATVFEKYYGGLYRVRSYQQAFAWIPKQ